MTEFQPFGGYIDKNNRYVREDDSEKVRPRFLEYLIELRDDYKSEIPTDIVHSTSDDNKYKVRAVWFACVLGAGDIAVNRGYITNQETIKEINLKTQELQKMKDESPLTTAEQIEKGDELLELVIKEVQGDKSE